MGARLLPANEEIIRAKKVRVVFFSVVGEGVRLLSTCPAKLWPCMDAGCQAHQE